MTAATRYNFEVAISSQINLVLNQVADLEKIMALQYYTPDDGKKIAKALRRQVTITCNKLRTFKPVAGREEFKLKGK